MFKFIKNYKENLRIKRELKIEVNFKKSIIKDKITILEEDLIQIDCYLKQDTRNIGKFFDLLDLELVPYNFNMIKPIIELDYIKTSINKTIKTIKEFKNKYDKKELENRLAEYQYIISLTKKFKGRDFLKVNDLNDLNDLIEILEYQDRKAELKSFRKTFENDIYILSKINSSLKIVKKNPNTINFFIDYFNIYSFEDIDFNLTAPVAKGFLSFENTEKENFELFLTKEFTKNNNDNRVLHTKEYLEEILSNYKVTFEDIDSILSKYDFDCSKLFNESIFNKFRDNFLIERRKQLEEVLRINSIPNKKSSNRNDGWMKRHSKGPYSYSRKNREG